MSSVYWLIFACILLVGEMISPNFFLFWFALGALTSFILSFFVTNLYIQLGVFVVVSIVLLLATKPLVKRFMASRTNVSSNVDSIINKKAKVNVKVNGLDFTGKVKVDGEIWSAMSEDENDVFDVDSEVVVCRVDGVKLIVKGGN